MTKRWKNVLICVVIIVGIMFVFPPFHVVYAPGVIIDKGHAFFMNPPKFQNTIVSTVDTHTLLVQVGVVLLLGLLACYLIREKQG
ncbi:MAG: hypothetical protein ABFD81_15055 [Syntrophaceae bacterium]